jgi:IS1 family transposase
MAQTTGLTIARCATSRNETGGRGTRRTRNLCRFKKSKIWIWTAIDHFKQGILGWTLGDHSAETFAPL